jgi:hypothetical protein
MNWKLIFQLSLFGLIMAFATISLIPERSEFIFWIIIFVFCAWAIAKKAPGKYFLYGFLLSLVNSIWITIAHVAFFISYLSNHPDMSPEKMHMPAAMSDHPRLLMVIIAPIFGAVFGLFQGLFAWLASKFVKSNLVSNK